jgi:ketosteroid isomerase-like protein
MTFTTDANQPAVGPDAPGWPAYPDVADVSRASAEAAAFFRSYFTAKTSKDIEATHAHFHQDKTVYFDATLGWGWITNADLRKVWEQYMPGWTAEARSYPTQILGDITSAVVFMTDTPELFGGEIRAIGVIDFEEDKIVRWVDYWDGRGFGNRGLVSSMRVPDDSYPQGLGASTVTDRGGKIAGAAHQLSDALAAGDSDRAGELFAYDAQFEDMALRTQIRGQAAITRYLQRAMPDLPYAQASIRHIVGTDQGGGYEWSAEGRAVPRGAAALELGQDGKITKFTVVWDGSLLDDTTITATAAHAVDV